MHLLDGLFLYEFLDDELAILFPENLPFLLPNKFYLLKLFLMLFLLELA